jgi:WD40 repeat protein
MSTSAFGDDEVVGDHEGEASTLTPEPAKGYTAFISYSHGADLGFAYALEGALLRFAPPPRGEPSLRLFRDASNLSATPGLWPTIQQALDGSEFLLLIASEGAASSKWCTDEVRHWRSRHDPARLLIALVSGVIEWDGQRSDFDFARSTALPPSIAGAFVSEPLYIDFRGIAPQNYDLNHPTFCDRIASIASTLRGVSKDDLFGFHVSRRLAAEATRLASEAELALRDGFPERSLLLSSTALKLTDDRGEPRVPAAESALRTGLSQLGGHPIGLIATHWSVLLAGFDCQSRWLATAGSGGQVTVHDLHAADPTVEPVVLQHGDRIVHAAFDDNGRWLVSHAAPDDGLRTPVTIRCWDSSAAWEPHDVGIGNGSPFACASLSVERSHLVTGGEDGLIRIWNLAEAPIGEPAYTATTKGPISQVKFAANAGLIEAYVDGVGWELWRLDDHGARRLERQLEAHEKRLFLDSASPDGKWVVVKGEDEWFLQSLDGEKPAIPLPAYGGKLWKYAFSGDSLWLATATGPLRYEELAQVIEPEYTVRLLDLVRGKWWDLAGHEDIVCDVSFTQDGNRVISASIDRTMRLWDLTKLRQFQRLRIQAGLSGDASLVPGGPGGFDAHEEHVAQQDFRQPTVLYGGDAGLFHILVSPDGKWLVSSGHGATARLWRAGDTLQPASPILLPNLAMPEHLAWISATQKWFFYTVLARASGVHTELSANRQWLLLRSPDTLMLFDVANDRSAGSLKISLDMAHLSPDGRWLVLVANGIALLCDLTKPGLESAKIETERGPIRKVFFSPCGRWLISAEGAESVCIRDLRQSDIMTAASVLSISGPEAPNVAFNTVGDLLFTGGEDGSATVWQLDDAGHAKVLTAIGGHKSQPGGVRGQFSSDGRWLATFDLERMQVWNLPTWQRAFTLIEQGMKTGFQLAFTPDGRWLIVSRWERVERFDLQAGSPAITGLVMRDYPNGRIGITLSGDGRWLVTDDTPVGTPKGRVPAPAVFVYELKGSNPAESGVTLPGLKTSAVVEISWDCRWITTTSEGRVRVWPLGLPSLLDIVNATVGRELTNEERTRHLVD